MLIQFEIQGSLGSTMSAYAAIEALLVARLNEGKLLSLIAYRSLDKDAEWIREEIEANTPPPPPPPPPAGNLAPKVNAGGDRTSALAVVFLYGTASDDNLPDDRILGVTWSKISGPGNVVFAEPNAKGTLVRFSASGVYVLRLTASDGELESSDDVVVKIETVVPPPPPPPPGTNAPPVVSAGPNRTVQLGAPLALTGSVTDDGLPVGGTISRTWTKVDGTGMVSFGSPSSDVTTVSFSNAGTYVLRLTATDGNLPASSTVTVTVYSAPPPPPPPPPPTPGTQFYVSPSGSDGAAGTLAAPWKTIEKAIMSTGPGDVVNLRAGKYNESMEMRGDPGNRFGKTMGGSPAGWWTIQSYPGETATLTNDFNAYSVQYCRIQDLTFAAPGALGVGTADWISAQTPRSHHVEIRNITYSGVQPKYGAMEVKFDDSLVEGCDISITTGGDTMDHGIYLHNGRNNTIRGNTISGMSGYGIHVYDEKKGSSDAQTFYDNVIIEGNTCFDSRERAGIILSQGGDTQIRSAIVRNNVTWGSPSGGIDLNNYGGQPMLGIQILNNTCIDRIQWGKPTVTVTLKDNIALGGINPPNPAGPVTQSGNFVSGDPMFVDAANHDYHLKAGSPAEGKGAF